MLQGLIPQIAGMPETKILYHQRTISYVAAIFLILILYLSSIDAQSTRPMCPIGFEIARSKINSEIVCYTLKEGPFKKKFDDCVGNMFTMKLYYSLDLPKIELRVWTDYRSPYPGGPLVDWSYTNNMGQVLDISYELYQSPTVNIKEDLLCVVIDPVKNFTVAKCDEINYRYCFVEPYPDKMDGCTKLANSSKFWSPQPMCIKLLQKGNKTWEQSKIRCRQIGGSLLARGWIYSNYFKPYGTTYPMNMVYGIVSGRKTLKYDYDGDKTEIPYKNWNFDNDTIYANHLGAIQNHRWVLVGKNEGFDTILCEKNVDLKYVSLNLSAGRTNLILTINDTSLDSDNIRCYTDSFGFSPTLVNSDSYSSSELSVTASKDGYYWCTHTDPKNFLISESNKELFVANVAATHNMYAVLIATSIYNFTIIRKMYEEWKNVVTKYISDTFKHSDDKSCVVANIFEVKRQYADGQRVLLHVNVCPGMVPLMSSVPGSAVLYMRSVYYCDKEKHLSLGNKSYISDCKVHICEGDYIEGVFETTTDQKGCHATTSKPITPDDHGVKTKTKDPIIKAQQFNEVLDDLDSLVINKSDINKIQKKFENVSSLVEKGEGEVNISGSMLNRIENIGIQIGKFSSDKIETDNIVLLAANATSKIPVWGLRIAERSEDESDYDAEDDAEDVIGDDAKDVIGDVAGNENSLYLYKDIIIVKGNSSDKELKNELVVKLPNSVAYSNKLVSFVVYGKNSVFQKPDMNGVYAISVVVNVKIENFTKFPDNETIDIQFASVNDSKFNQKIKCAYWQYTDNDPGFWSEKGCKYVPAENGSMDTCRCNHLTHFAQVVVSYKVSPENKAMLELITIIGCWMSIIGLILIGLTALNFRSWRDKYTNKVWLQLCVSILLVCICFLVFIFARFNERDILCRLIGIVLHYTVLVSFCWMLVNAVVSYKELVMVFHEDTRHKLLKAAAFAWGAPFVVVVLLVSIAPQSYVKRNDDKSPGEGAFCYPTETAQWASVYAPIAVMLLANWTLFALILWSVFVSRKVENHHINTQSKEALRCASVSCMLAFLFGLPWTFGMFPFVVTAYLFTILATLQGFVLFMFIVVLNKNTRDLWLFKMKLKQRRLFSSAAYTNRSVPDAPLRPNHRGNGYDF